MKKFKNKINLKSILNNSLANQISKIKKAKESCIDSFEKTTADIESLKKNIKIQKTTLETNTNKYEEDVKFLIEQAEKTFKDIGFNNLISLAVGPNILSMNNIDEINKERAAAIFNAVTYEIRFCLYENDVTETLALVFPPKDLQVFNSITKSRCAKFMSPENIISKYIFRYDVPIKQK